MESKLRSLTPQAPVGVGSCTEGERLPTSPDNVKELEEKFAAFVRDDMYGTMGQGQLPWQEKVLLGVALVTLVPIRVTVGMALVLFYYLICRVCTLFSAQEEEGYAHMGGWRRAVIVRTGMFLSRVMLFVLGFYRIKETFRNPETDGKSSGDQTEFRGQLEEPGRSGAIISNHTSYLDILYHMYSSFPSFVAKWLNFLWLVLSGIVVDRIREAYQNKFAPVLLVFPEGTTTNGDFLLPFKTGAFLSKAPVLPVILRYPYRRFSLAWESISAGRHLVFLLCQFVNHIEITWLPAYYPSKQEKDDPKLYAENVRRLMAREGNLALSDIGLAEKRIYHAILCGNGSLPTVLHQKDD